MWPTRRAAKEAPPILPMLEAARMRMTMIPDWGVLRSSSFVRSPEYVKYSGRNTIVTRS